MSIFNRLRGDPTRLKVSPPKPTPDRTGIAIAAVARNEARNIQDWLTFHAIAGISEVFLYDDGSTDGTVEIAQRFTRIPVTVIPWHLDITISVTNLKLAKQELAYAHAVCAYGARFRWMTFIDLDELIVPVTAAIIPDALKPLEHHTNISLPWAMFGHSGHDTPPDNPLPFAYTKRARQHDGALRNFKTIADPCDISLIRTHKLETRTNGLVSVNDVGVAASDYRARRDANFWSVTNLQLNHYFLKSRSEFQTKVQRGDITSTKAKNVAAHRLALAQQIEADTVEDNSAIEFLERKGISNSEAFRAYGTDPAST